MYKRHQSVTLHNGEEAGSDFLVRVIRLDYSDRLQLPGDVGDFLYRWCVSSGATSFELHSLTPKEEEDFKRYSYRSKLPIFITGDTEKRATNLLMVNSAKVHAGDTPFALFLRLIVELFKNKKGTVSKARLINAGYIKADGEFQAINRLRQVFNGVLCGLDTQEFIEVFEPKTLRLSTHPALVKYDKEKLLRHHNVKIRRLAKRLPS